MRIVLRLPAVIAAVLCLFNPTRPFFQVTGLKLRTSIGDATGETPSLSPVEGTGYPTEEQEANEGNEVPALRRSLRLKAAALRTSLEGAVSKAKRRLGRRRRPLPRRGDRLVEEHHLVEEGSDEEEESTSGPTSGKRRSLRLRAAALRESLRRGVGGAKRKLGSLVSIGKTGSEESSETLPREGEEPKLEKSRGFFRRRPAFRRKRVRSFFLLLSRGCDFVSRYIPFYMQIQISKQYLNASRRCSPKIELSALRSTCDRLHPLTKSILKS